MRGSYQMGEVGILFAPVEYWNATIEDLKDNCNGCGTGGWKGKLVPETVWGLRISEACNIHDWMYARGLTWRDKVIADRYFRRNMKLIVKAKTENRLLRRFRLWRVEKYYLAVKHAGFSAYEEDKPWL